jgi:site-specific recombinase XerD/CHAT domain-containing protein
VNYLDFELVIGPGNSKKRVYPVFVNASPAGEANEFMKFPFSEQELENQLQALQYALMRSSNKRRKIISPEDQTVQEFGRAIFDALFIEEVRSRYDVSQEIASHHGKGLRIKLHIQPPELASLPWEFLYDKRQDKYICLSNDTPIVRYLDLSKPAHSLTVTPPLSILGMIASPKNLPDLDVEREKHRLEKSLEKLRNNGLIKLTWLEGRTWRDLQREMRNGPWHIFHFIGHGDFDAEKDEGIICLEDDEGYAYNFTASELARILDHRSLRLIVLNSCDGARGSKYDIFSSTAAILVRQCVSAVLAMQYEITDTAAIELSRVFYEVLAEGYPVDTAVAEARKAISITSTLEWGTPVLHMRSPDGVIFNLPQISNSISKMEPIHSSPPIDEQVSHWMRAKASKSIKTKIAYEENIKNFRAVLHKHDLDLDSEDVPRISSLLQKWAGQAIRRSTISPRTYNQHFFIIQSFYKFALKQHWMKINPIAMVEPRKPQTTNTPLPLDPERVKDALKQIHRFTFQGKRDYALLCILLTTGLHTSEIADLRCGDVTKTESGVTITYKQKHGDMAHQQLRKSTAQILLDYLTALYPNKYVADDPIWLSYAKNGSREKAISTQAISDICKKHLGTSKVEAIRQTYLAMTHDVGVKGIEELLDINVVSSTEQPQMFP